MTSERSKTRRPSLTGRGIFMSAPPVKTIRQYLRLNSKKMDNARENSARDVNEKQHIPKHILTAEDNLSDCSQNNKFHGNFEKRSVPVLNTFMVKHLHRGHEPGTVNIMGTFIQHQLGMLSEAPFAYRFNDASPGPHELLMRTTKHRRTPVPMSTTTFTVNVPTKHTVVFDRFPYRMIEASVEVSITSRMAQPDEEEFPSGSGEKKEGAKSSQAKGVHLVPSLQISLRDERHILCMKSPWYEQNRQSWAGATKQEILEMAYREGGMDKMGEFNLLPVPPTYEVNKKGDQFKVTFWLEDPALSGLIRVLLPITVLAVLTFLNFYAGWKEKLRRELYSRVYEDKVFGEEFSEEGYVNKKMIEKAGYVVQPFYESDMPATDYLQMSAAIALAAIFLLPDIQDKRPQMRFTTNHAYIIMVLVSIALSSFPPVWNPVPGCMGCAGMLISFVFPLNTVRLYHRKKRGLLQQHDETFKEVTRVNFLRPENNNWDPELNLQDLIPANAKGLPPVLLGNKSEREQQSYNIENGLKPTFKPIPWAKGPGGASVFMGLPTESTARSHVIYDDKPERLKTRTRTTTRIFNSATQLGQGAVTKGNDGGAAEGGDGEEKLATRRQRSFSAGIKKVHV
mmetsp:Transcript_48423/g.135863  ORF Transcript_48423/g.135863 Transcript_48423/m.135863 type:complete len:623 (-) Transcript_48423:2981-4849(-)